MARTPAAPSVPLFHSPSLFYTCAWSFEVNYNRCRAKLRLPGFNLWPVRRKVERKRLRSMGRSRRRSSGGRKRRRRRPYKRRPGLVQDLWVIQERQHWWMKRERERNTFVRYMLSSRPPVSRTCTTALVSHVGEIRTCAYPCEYSCIFIYVYMRVWIYTGCRIRCLLHDFDRFESMEKR